MLLEGKRVLVTGLLTHRSIAFAAAREAQAAGAEVILTSYGRSRRATERAARGLAAPVEVLELDASKDDDFPALARELEERWGGLDGALHAIAWAPPALVRGGLLAGERGDAARAFEISAYSYKRLAETVAPLMPRGGSIVGLTFAPEVAWPGYDWLGVLKAALEALNRYLAYHLGPAGVRTNLLAAGPIRSVASEVFERFDVLCDAWEAQAPLGWDSDDPTDVGRAACLLLSDWSSSMTGGILHADGGYHAMARPAEFNFGSAEPLSVSA
ncbi:MAG TPA: enoyl-ACP reductase FabI [Thermoleophilaceae bacterium]